MSDQTPSQKEAPAIDGSRLINVPAGPPGPPGPPGGLVTINGDNTAAQTLTAGPGISVVDLGAGAHRVDLAGGGGALVSINGDTTGAQTITPTAPMSFTNPGAGAHALTVATFAGVGTTGVVPNPGGVTGNRTLKSDGSWFVSHNHSQAAGAANLADNTLTLVASITIAAGEDGDYCIEGSVAFAANAAGNRGLVMQIGAANIGSVNAQAVNDAHGTGNIITRTVVLSQLPAGTQIDLYAIQTSGGPLAIVTGVFFTGLRIYRLNN